VLRERLRATHEEAARRLAEIAEKYDARHVIRPYRLHVLLVPALRVAADVLRGSRRYPMSFDWLLPAGVYAPVRCPSCARRASAGCPGRLRDPPGRLPGRREGDLRQCGGPLPAAGGGCAPRRPRRPAAAGPRPRLSLVNRQAQCRPKPGAAQAQRGLAGLIAECGGTQRRRRHCRY